MRIFDRLVKETVHRNFAFHPRARLVLNNKRFILIIVLNYYHPLTTIIMLIKPATGCFKYFFCIMQCFWYAVFFTSVVG